MLSNYDGDGVAKVTCPWHDVGAESCWRWHYRGDLARVRCRYRVMLAMVLPSHAGDGAVVATWPWRDVEDESCW
jgi:hypothetical protein